MQRAALSPNRDAAAATLADRLRRVERERAGYAGPADAHRTAPLAAHLADWLAVLAARGRGPGCVALKRARVAAVLGGCGFVLPADLSAERLGRFLDGPRTGPRRLGVQTTNDYLQAVSQLGSWMVENDRLPRNPFARVKKGNPERDRRHVRRVLDAAELRALVAAAAASPTAYRGLSEGARAAAGGGHEGRGSGVGLPLIHGPVDGVWFVGRG